MKKWYNSRVLWVNIVAMIATLATVFGVDLGLTAEVQASIVAGIMSVVNIVLRFDTDTPIEKAAK